MFGNIPFLSIGIENLQIVLPLKYEVTINGAFYADSKLVDMGSRKFPKKGLSKKPLKRAKSEQLKICIVFAYNLYPEHF